MHNISNDDFQLFEATPGKRVVFLPDAPAFTIIAVSKDMGRFVGRTNEQMMGKSVFEAFPANPDDPDATGHKNLRDSLEYVIQNKLPHQMEKQRYDVAAEDGSFKEIYWQNTSTPVLNGEGAVICIIHTAEDITEKVKAAQREEKIKGLEQAYGLFMQAPFAIHIFTGPDLIIDLANPPTLELWGKAEDVTGKRLLDVLPEMKEQGYDAMMREVMQTGKPQFFYEVPLALKRPGKESVGYFNFVYQPYYNKGALKAESVLIIGHEVTQQVLAKRSIEESEARLNSIVEQTPAPTLVLQGDDFVIEHINGPMLEMMGRGGEVIGQPFLSIMPELEGQYAWAQVQRVYREGIEFNQPEVLVPHRRTGVMQDYYYNVSYRPIKEESRITGMIQVAIDVTEQVASRKRLEESEERYRTLLEETTVATALYTGPDIRVQYANATMLRYWGKGREVIGKTFRQALPELESQPFPDLLEAVYATGESYIGTEEKAELRVAGELRPFYFNFTYKALRDAEGRIYAIHHTAVDVTEQVTARKTIEQSEGNLTNLVLQAPIGICVMNAATLVTEIVNDTYVEIAGKPYEAIMGKYFWDIFPEAAPYYEAALQGVIDSGKAFHAIEVPLMLIRHGKEESLHVTFVYEPLKDAYGRVNKVVVWAVDNTAQVQTRQKIERSEQNFRNLILEAPVGVCVLDANTLVAEIANDRFIEVAGQPFDAIVGKMYWEAFAEARPYYEAALQQVVKEGTTYYANEVELELVRHDVKEKVYVTFVYLPMKNGEESVTKVVIYVIENTVQVLARQKIEEVVHQRTSELQAVNKELQRSNANLEEFAHAASHDLKEPIRKITFFTGHLKDQLGDHLKEAEIRSFVRIENAIERMGNLIDDLLLYSHVNQRPHEKESIDLTVKVQQVLEDLELDIAEKKAVVHVGKLPVVQGYRRQLQQLFQNLISNAIKYSKKDVPPHIDITASEVRENGKPYYLIAVRDNGIGFAPEYADKIFQMFTRLHGKGEYSGTGVGLSIVKKVVENHHGFIKVESAPSKGSTFEIYLPL